MNGFLEQDLSSSTVRQRINCCRLFLQVTLLSDISNLAGDHIERNAWLRSKPMPWNDDARPIHPRPDEASWPLWRKALSTSICDNPMKNVLASWPGTFSQPLRFWLPGSEPRSSPRWQSYLSPLSARPPGTLALQPILDQHPPSLQHCPLQQETCPEKYPRIQSTERRCSNPTHTEWAPAPSQPPPHSHNFGTRTKPHNRFFLCLH